MSNFSKSSKNIGLLERLSYDLNNLYCITKDSRIEDLFIKIAESNESDIQEFLNLLYEGSFKKLKPFKRIIEALKNLQNTPASLSPSEFVTYALNHFPSSIPIIVCFSQLKHLNLPILYPLSKKLSLTGHFQQEKSEEVESVLKDLTVINNELQSFLRAKTESEYEDELVAKKPKQTKKDKIKTLTMFLLDRFSGEVINGFQNSHLSSIASEIGSSLLNPTKILSFIQNTSNNNISSDVINILAKEAFEISKIVLSKIEPHNFESDYALIKGRIFRFTGDINHGQFYMYYQKILTKEINQTYGMSHDKENDNSIEDLNINPSKWTNPQAVILLSLILTRISHAGN